MTGTISFTQSGAQVLTLFVPSSRCSSVLASYDLFSSSASSTKIYRGVSCSSDPVVVGSFITVRDFSIGTDTNLTVGKVGVADDAFSYIPIQDIIMPIGLGLAFIIGIVAGNSR